MGRAHERPLLGLAHEIPETNLNPQRIVKQWSSLVVPPNDFSPLLARLLSLSRSFSLKNAGSVSSLRKTHISTCGKVPPPSVLSPLLLPSAH